jgi:hypothetical protein
MLGWLVMNRAQPLKSKMTFWVPSVLIGTPEEVTHKLRPLLAIMRGTREWGTAMSSWSLVDIVPTDLPISFYAAWSETSPSVCLHLVVPELKKICAHSLNLSDDGDRDEWFSCLRDCLVAGLEYSWCALAYLANSGPVFPETEASRRERSSVSLAILRLIMAHWTTFCGIEGRFTTSWPLWSAGVVNLLRELRTPESAVQELLRLNWQDFERGVLELIRTFDERDGGGGNESS